MCLFDDWPNYIVIVLFKRIKIVSNCALKNTNNFIIPVPVRKFRFCSKKNSLQIILDLAEWLQSKMKIFFPNYKILKKRIFNVNVTNIPAILDLKFFNSTFDISMSSMRIWPDSSSVNLKMAENNVVFPAPVRPTTPIYA